MEAGGVIYVEHPSRKDWFTLWGTGDWHLWNRACSEKLLDHDLAEIREDPHALWVGTGDYADYIGYHDGKRFDPDCVSERVTIADLGRLGQRQTEEVRDKMKPIASKCCGLILGNHELKYQQTQEQANLHGWLCTELGARNFGYSVLFDVIFCRVTGIKTVRVSRNCPKNCNARHRFRIFAHHGSGFAATPGGKLNRLIRFMNMMEADIYLMGHVHDQTGRRMVEIRADATCENITQREKLGVICGTYLRTYTQGSTGYGEQKGYEPVPLGARFVRIHPDSGQVKAEI